MLWVNGDVVAEDQPVVLAHDHGLVVGDGVFETCEVKGGVVFALTRHLRRLRGKIDAAQYRPALQVDAEPVRLDPHGASVPIAKFAKPRRQCPEPTSQS